MKNKIDKSAMDLHIHILNKEGKGITLIALILTIIILLILSGIAISQITKGSLFEKAKSAKEKSNNEQELEKIKLAEYREEIEEYINGTRANETKRILYDSIVEADKNQEIQIELNNDIKKYRYIMFNVAWRWGSEEGNENEQYYIDTEFIEIQEDTTKNSDYLFTYGYAENRKNIGCCFLKDNKLKLLFAGISNTDSPMAITKIVGIE